MLPTDEESGFYIACGNGCYKSYGNNSWIKLDNYSHSYVCFLDAEHGLSFSTNSSANDALGFIIQTGENGVKTNL